MSPTPQTKPRLLGVLYGDSIEDVIIEDSEEQENTITINWNTEGIFKLEKENTNVKGNNVSHEFDNETNQCIHCHYTAADIIANGISEVHCIPRARQAQMDMVLKTQGDPQEVRDYHSQMVAGLCKNGEEIRGTMTGAQMHALHMAIGISGESGEIIDAIKKWCVYQGVLSVDNIIEELGDLEFYMEGLRQAFGIEREATLEANHRKLGKRYRDHQYSDQQAQDRADKVGEES